VFVNGSLGVYDVAALLDLFGTNGQLENTVQLAGLSAPWDLEIGKRLWAKHGVGAYEKVTHLTSIYSSYGDVLTTEADRMAMLNNGVRGVHQVKSEATV
jgi:hypothetical protein